MSEPNLSRSSLTELYRREIASRVDTTLTDADQIDAQIAISPARAELSSFRSELEPLSAGLSAELAVMFAADRRAAHVRAIAPRRVAHATRHWRGAAAALAASLIVATGIWGMHRSVQAPQVAKRVLPDRIFTGFDEHAIASRPPTGDVIFRGEFRSDEIFNSKTHDG